MTEHDSITGGGGFLSKGLFRQRIAVLVSATDEHEDVVLAILSKDGGAFGACEAEGAGDHTRLSALRIQGRAQSLHGIEQER